jgi:hypothetical protein
MRYSGTILFKGESAKGDRLEVHEFLVLPDGAAVRATLFWDGERFALDTAMTKVAPDTYKTGRVHLITDAGAPYETPSVITLKIARHLSRSLMVTGHWEEGGEAFDFDDESEFKATNA